MKRLYAIAASLILTGAVTVWAQTPQPQNQPAQVQTPRAERQDAPSGRTGMMGRGMSQGGDMDMRQMMQHCMMMRQRMTAGGGAECPMMKDSSRTEQLPSPKQ